MEQIKKEKGRAAVLRALIIFIMAAIVVLSMTVGNAAAQPMGYGEGSGVLSWEMYRQRQIEMQLDLQRQQLDLQRQQLGIQRQQQELEVQRQQLEMKRQQLEIQRQQQQMEFEKQMIERERK
ncbi:MAG: hypothetical protein ABFD82_05305, partial [Syntrophaceae bacterium]